MPNIIQRALGTLTATTKERPYIESARARMEAVKATETHQAVIVGGGRAKWTPRNYADLAEEGYETSDVVYACVRYVVDNFLTLPIKLYQGRPGTSDMKEVMSHDAQELLKRPNPEFTESEFREMWMSYFLIAGNTYTHGVPPGELSSRRGEPQELWCLRPDKMEVVASGDWRDPIGGYVYDKKIDLPKEEIGHARLFHPRNFWYGLGPTEPAARGIDQYNAAGQWNASMLQNDAAPRGLITLKGTVSDDSKSAFEASYKQHMAGSENARRTMIVRSSDGVDYVRFALDAMEMDWMNGTNMSARAICRAYRVPAQLVGIPGDTTYANFEQAEKLGWTGATLPMVARYCDHLTHWLLPKFSTAEQDLYFWYDDSSVEALQADKAENRESAYEGFKAGVLTQRQAAKMAGEDDSLAADAYIWELDRRKSATPAETAAAMDKARKEFGPRVMAALRAHQKTAVN